MVLMFSADLTNGAEKPTGAARAARAPPGTAVSAAPVDAMCRAHRQIMQQARLEQKFSAKPKAWLDWAAVLTARARAVREYELRKEEEGGPGARTRLFDAALLTWLTVVPPDRVGVARKLQLGVTLKPTATNGFELDLRTPDAHKTAALFGPSTSPVPAAACALLRAWLAEAGLATTAHQGRRGRRVERVAILRRRNPHADTR